MDELKVPPLSKWEFIKELKVGEVFEIDGQRDYQAAKSFAHRNGIKIAKRGNKIFVAARGLGKK